jgi:hypothetical protein
VSEEEAYDDDEYYIIGGHAVSRYVTLCHAHWQHISCTTANSSSTCHVHIFQRASAEMHESCMFAEPNASRGGWHVLVGCVAQRTRDANLIHLYQGTGSTITHFKKAAP